MFPAWWVAVLWKRLVGTQALATSGDDGPVHAFTFDSKEGNRTVTVLANWDIDEGRMRSVVVSGCRRSAAVYVLNATGEYARSVVLDDDTIVTIHDSSGIEPAPGRWRMRAMRWRVPPRAEVEKHGFFTPRPVPWDRKP